MTVTTTAPPAPPAPTAPPGGHPGGGRGWGQRLIIASGVIVAAIALLGALVVGVAWWKLGSFQRVDLDLAPKADDRPLNFLVVGSDSRDSISEDDPDAGAFLGEDVGGQRTDTIIVMRVDPGANTISLLSIPRDLWVPLGGTGENDRINSAYAEGGAQELIDTVRGALRIEINHYVEVNFGGFKSLVDTVGGVPMYFDRPMFDENSGLVVKEAGCTTLDGTQALAFARSRHLQYLNEDTGEYEQDLTADLGRITRQQLFLRKAMDQVSSLGLTDVTKLNRLVGVATDNVTFDDDMSTSDLLSLARRFSTVGSGAMTSYALPTELFETPAGASVVLLKEAEAQSTLDLFRGVETTTTSTTRPVAVLDPASVAVQVLNGTGISGQAAEAKAGLEASGFADVEIGNTDETAMRTQVRYAPALQPAAQTLASVLQPGVQLVEDATATDAVVLITGADFSGITVPGDATAGETPTDTGSATTTSTAVGVAPPEQAPAGADCR